jgi:hypothetical protein
VVAEKVLESNCEECKKVKDKMSDPECIYMKGARVSEDIIYICLECNAKRNEEFLRKNFPEICENLEKLKAEGKWFKNNVSIPDSCNKKKKKKK